MAEMSASARREIEWACTHLTHRFAQHLDARDYEAVVALFTEDGALARPSNPAEVTRGRADLLAAYRARPAGKVTRHFITNTVIDVDGPTEAHGVCYILMYTAEPGEGRLKADPVQAIGAYHDRFVKVGDEWKFRERIGSVAMMAGTP
jgi:hypothetical protein